MATQVDPVRNTLDHLALDPAAKADRPYLISMLRRLGYSEVEIQQYLGEMDSKPAIKAPEPAPEADGRVIEIEYSGPGQRPFRFVEIVSEEELALGIGLNAGEEVLDTGPSMEEVDRLMAEGDVEGDFGEFEAQLQEEVKEFKGFDEAAGEVPAEGGFDGGLTTAGGDIDLESPEGLPAAEGEALPEGGEAPAGEESWGAVDEAAPPEAEVQVGEPLVEFTEIRPNPARILPRVGAQGELEVFPGTGSDGEPGAPQDERGRWPGEPGEGAEAQTVEEGPFRHGEWTLYSRDIELGDGKAQRIYFFSKGEPQNGSPATLPEGYEVAENERTGLPYLRALGGSDMESPVQIDQIEGTEAQTQPRRKRVRIARVQAASREEAERKVASAGDERNVLSSMPIDIEER